MTKSPAQLDAEIAAVLARPKRITITVHHRIDDDYEAWQVSDDGGDFDDSEEYADRTEADDDADERHAYYIKQPNVTIKLRSS